jgi:hypothetical protein
MKPTQRFSCHRLAIGYCHAAGDPATRQQRVFITEQTLATV